MFDRKWWVSLLLVGLMGAEGLGLEEHFLQKEIETVKSQEAALVVQGQDDQKSMASIDKRLSVLEATTGGHVTHFPHLPGSVCVCTRASREKIHSKICEFGEKCNQEAIQACETQHIGFSCQPAE